MLVDKLLERLLYKEQFTDAHATIRDRLKADMADPLTRLGKRTIMRLIYAKTLDTQSFGVELLRAALQRGGVEPADLEVQEMVKLGNHALFLARETCRDLYGKSVERLKGELGDALRVLDSDWEDTREFAFAFFDEHFGSTQLTASVLVGICDSIRPDVQAFGKQLIEKFYGPEDGPEYVLKLSQHPAPNVERFVTQYLDEHALGNMERMKELEPYFRRVLARVNKGRPAKDKVLGFLKDASLLNAECATYVVRVLNFASVTMQVGDQSTITEILLNINEAYPELQQKSAVVGVAVEARTGRRRRQRDAV